MNKKTLFLVIALAPLQQLFAQMRSMNREELKKRHPDINAEELARMDRESEDLVKSFPIDEMLNDMVPIYQRHFTQPEIAALTAFYSSPAGQKFLHETPAVTTETMRIVYPKIQARVDAALKRAEQKEERGTGSVRLHSREDETSARPRER